jgi:hypothetical protein
MTDQPDETDHDLRPDEASPRPGADDADDAPQDTGTGPNEANNHPDDEDEDPDGRSDAG